jgi:hypothetical protein
MPHGVPEFHARPRRRCPVYAPGVIGRARSSFGVVPMYSNLHQRYAAVFPPQPLGEALLGLGGYPRQGTDA